MPFGEGGNSCGYFFYRSPSKGKMEKKGKEVFHEASPRNDEEKGRLSFL